MKAIQNIILSCAKATEYVNLREERVLSPKQSLQLKVHLLVCKTCRAYEKQSATINKMFSVFKEKATASTKNANFKENLKAKVEKS